MFCLGLSYVKGGAVLGYNKHVLSMKTKSQVPLLQSITHMFAPYSPWHNLQQFEYSNKSTVYIFLTGLCASCFCTVCTVHLVRVRLKMWKVEDSACQCASCVYSKQNKAHMFINMTLSITVYIYYTILETNISTNMSLAYCTSGHNANSTHKVCITGVCKVCKSTPN